MIKEYQLRKLQNTYEVALHYKGVKVKVLFTGGNVYNGTMPKLRTNDPFKMKAIESSELFKTKEVVVLRTINDGKSSGQVVVQQRKKGTPLVNRRAQTTPPSPVSTLDADPPLDPPTDKNEGTTETGGDGESKTFANLGEAILFIAEQWQITVQTENEARKVLKEHGINPTIKRG